MLVRWVFPLALSYRTALLFYPEHTFLKYLLKPLLGCAPSNQERQNLKNAVQGVGGGGVDGGGGRGEGGGYILKKCYFQKPDKQSN